MLLSVPRPVRRGCWAVLAFAAIASSGAAVGSDQQPQSNKPTQRRSHWTTRWSFQNVDVQNLFSKLRSIGLEIPVQCEGNVSVNFKVGIPLRKLRDGKAYRFEGHVKADRLQIENLLLEDFEGDIEYADGVLRFENIDGRWSDARPPTSSQSPSESQPPSESPAGRARPSGSLAGSAQMQLLPRGQFRADLQARRLPIGPIRDLLSATSGETFDGKVSGQLHAAVPVDRLRDPNAWKIQASAVVDEMKLGTISPLTVDTGNVKISDGVLLAETIRLGSPELPDVHIDLAAQIELSGRQRFQVQLRSNDLPVDAVSELMLRRQGWSHGKLDLQVDGRGELAAGKWVFDGAIGSPDLTLFGIDLGLLEHKLHCTNQEFKLQVADPVATRNLAEINLRRIAATYRLTEETLLLEDLSAKIFDGNAKGSATLVRGNGVHRASLRWQGIAPTLRHAALLDASLVAISSGSMQWSVDADRIHLPSSHQIDAEIDLEQIQLGNAILGNLRLEVSAADGRLTLVSNGKLLGGSLVLNAGIHAGPNQSWSALIAKMPEGVAKVDNVDLGRLVPIISPRMKRQFRGSASTEIRFDAKLASIQCTARDIAVDQQMLSRNLHLQARVQDGLIFFERIRGGFAGGSVSADGIWAIHSGQRRLQLRLAGLRAKDIFEPITNGSTVQGKISGSLSISGENGYRFRGSMTARDSSIHSIPTGTVHSPVHGTLSSDLRRWKVDFPSVRGQVAGGQFSGDSRLASSSTRLGAIDLQSRWKADKVDFGQLMADAKVSSGLAHGRLSGTLSLNGSGVRGLSDLSGRFDAKLGATQAAAIPGLMEADRLLGMVSLAGAQFKEGEVRGILGNGAATIDELWLTSDRIKVWSEGTVQLANQVMDLDVIISTGNAGPVGDQSLEGANAELLAFASQLALQAALPVATLLEVNQILSNRTIHLGFTGRMSDPRVRLKPLAIIREEAARFLLREILVAASAASSR